MVSVCVPVGTFVIRNTPSRSLVVESDVPAIEISALAEKLREYDRGKEE